jgi:hypothetical protein
MKLTKSLVLSSLILSSFGVMTAVSGLPQVHAAMREEMQTTLTERRDEGQLLAQQTQSNDSMTVTIQGCNRVGGDVICNLTLTSKRDGEFSIYQGKLYDRFGNFYDASDSKIANRDSSRSYVLFLKGMYFNFGELKYLSNF